MKHKDYLMQLQRIGDAMHACGEPLTDAQSQGIARVLAREVELPSGSEVYRSDALHPEYKTVRAA